MNFKIVGDSCCDLTKTQLDKGYFKSVPLILNVGGVEVIDDESFDQGKFLDMVAACPDSPKSSCPSPEAFMDAFEGAENIYIVTLSSKLSGSYNSAVLAKQIYLEDHPEVNICVFDSKSAAAAQHAICEKIEEYCLAGLEFAQVVKNVDEFIKKQETVFVLEDLETMRKNGRMSKVKAVMANVLNIKPVLIGVDGEIQMHDQARGMNKALNKLLYYIEKLDYDRTRTVYISNCESYERCMNVRKVLIEKFGFKKVVILEANGISSMYMNRGGVVLSF